MKSHQNKKISFMGDSITTFQYYIPEGFGAFYSRLDLDETGVRSPKDTWWSILLDMLGAELLVNNSWSGSCVTRSIESKTESHSSSDMRTSMLGTEECDPDLIIIYMGTNDRGLRRSVLGGEGSFNEAYGLMLDKIIAKYPASEIVCCTLPPVSAEYPVWLNIERETEVGEAYSEVIKAEADKRGVGIIELRSMDIPVDTVDGLHPTLRGMQTLAEAVCERLIKN